MMVCVYPKTGYATPREFQNPLEKRIMIMLNKTLLTSISAVFLAFGISQEASATSWFDYAQSASSVAIDKTDFPDTTSLAVVKVICPTVGYLLAQGSAGIQLAPVAGLSQVQAGIGITTDNTPPYAADPNHYNSIVQATNGSNAVLPAFIQRISSCTQGQTVTYRLVAWRESAGSGSLAFQPRLVVQFFTNRI
jgi:hypothetical protein